MNNILDIKTPAEKEAKALKSDYGLDNHGVGNFRMSYWNLPTEALYEEIAFRSEAKITHQGPVVANTGKHTARAASDKYIVKNRQPRIKFGGDNTINRSAPKSSTVFTTAC